MPLSAKWKKTIDDGMKSPNPYYIWNGIVIHECVHYAQRLGSTPGFSAVDPTLIIAMLWVESGGPLSPAWTGRVMQIGNPKDLGWPALRKHEGATEAVVDPEFLKKIDKATTVDLQDPVFNIKAGIAYLYTRMSISEIGSILDGRIPTIQMHVVAAGETATTIAQREGTTVELLRALNPNVNIDVLHAGQLLVFYKAHMGRKITGWRSFDPTTVAQRYNVGDANYAEKLRYVIGKLWK